jgi:hypothetical protein
MSSHDVTIGIRADTVQLRGELRELEYLLYRTTSVLGRMGLPENVDAAIATLQRLILTVRMLHTALALLEISTGYGTILGLITLAGVTVSVAPEALSLAQSRYVAPEFRGEQS